MYQNIINKTWWDQLSDGWQSAIIETIKKSGASFDPKDNLNLDSIKKLKELSIFGKEILSLDPLNDFRQLEKLKLISFPKISDIEAICNQNELQYLDITNCAFKNLEALRFLSKLHTLSLSSLIIKDFSFLNFLTNLKKISVISCPYWKSARVLEGNNRIEELYTNKSTVIKNMSGLKKVRLVMNSFPTIDNCPNIEQVEIFSRKKVPNIKKLVGLKKLKILEINSWVQVLDLSNLSNENFPVLNELNYAGTKVDLDSMPKPIETVRIVKYYNLKNVVDQTTQLTYYFPNAEIIKT